MADLGLIKSIPSRMSARRRWSSTRSIPLLLPPAIPLSMPVIPPRVGSSPRGPLPDRYHAVASQETHFQVPILTNSFAFCFQKSLAVSLPIELVETTISGQVSGWKMVEYPNSPPYNLPCCMLGHQKPLVPRNSLFATTIVGNLPLLIRLNVLYAVPILQATAVHQCRHLL